MSPQEQADMVASTPVSKEFSIATGHAPFAAAPQELAKIIEMAVQ